MGEWRLIGQDSDNHTFSPLTQINDKSVNRLALAWYADMPTRDGLVGEPLVADGVVYQSGVLSMVWANDVRTGKLLWSFDPEVKYTGHMIPNWGSRVNRGLALWGDKVYVGTGDCRLVAITRATGKKAWEADVCFGDERRTITGAPRVGGGKVFMGNANVDDGSRRGYVDAYDAETGKRLWRFYTIPGDPSKGFESKALERAAKTWGKDYWKRPGSASVYEGMTYDAKLNLLYFGTSSAIPDAPIDRAEPRGDELYSACVVAVNAETGEYVWHYKETPNNAWNFDSNSPIVIADLKFKGKLRRVLLHAPKNGFYYVLDAATGKFISGDRYGPRVDWASGIDPNSGRPIELPGARYYAQPGGVAKHYPGPVGARGLTPAAFSPLTGLHYLPAMDMAGRTYYHKHVATGGQAGFTLASGNTHFELTPDDILADGRSQLVAWDPVARKAVWKIDEGLPIFGGSLATAGNLVFAGKGQLLRAFAADSGKVLWSYEIPGGILAAPITVDVDGEQLVLFAVGNNGASGTTIAGAGTFLNNGAIRNAPSRLLAFELDGKAMLPATDLRDIYPKPPLPRFPADVAERGRKAFWSNGCDYCHGGEELNAVGSVPNLKKASAATHAAFEAIVIGGVLKPAGMPDFSYLDSATVKDIQAYIVNEAWDAYEAQTKE
jgi:quinohemoprotein ethanol dehydrogenase